MNPKKETAQEKFQRLREQNKADMMKKLDRIEIQQKAAAQQKSQQKEREAKAAAEGNPVKKPEEKGGFTPQRKLQTVEKLPEPMSELKPLAAKSRAPSPKLKNGKPIVHVKGDLSVRNVEEMQESHQRCTNCCGGLPGRGPGSSIGGRRCGAVNASSTHVDAAMACGSHQLHSQIGDYENCCGRLRGGADNSATHKKPERIRGGCGGGCSPPKQSFSPCARTPRNQSCPPPCWRSQRPTSCRGEQQGGRGNARSNCPCGRCGGPACQDNPGRLNDGGCCSRGPSQGAPCKCKCQSGKSFQPQGGCGGQSCGKMYSCAGSGGGSSCFPRNNRRREGAQCCGGNSPQQRSGCC